MPRTGLFLAAFFAAASPLLPQPSASIPNPAQARAAMAAGVAAAKRGDLDQARTNFARAVRLAPNVSATHTALGSILLEQGDGSAAVRELEIGHKLDPTDPSASLTLARANAALGNFDAAAGLFREALRKVPAPVLSENESLAYATALASTGDRTVGESTLRTALEQNPDSAALKDALGALLAQSGEMEQALPLFEQAVAADPSQAQPQYHLGVALLTLNRPDEALAPLELAAAANPNRFDVELQLGRALSALHRDKEALLHLGRAATLRATTTSPSSLYALALALQASGDPRSALPLFDLALADHSLADSSALINVALAHVQTGDTASALPLYTSALQLGPDTATLREDFGVAYLQKADLDRAIEQFRAGLSLEPDSAHLHYDLGLAFKLKDDLTSAVPELERAAQLDPQLPDPAYTLGIIYMQQGKFAAAAAQLRNATALQPDNGDAWALLGSVLKDSGDAPAATEALKRAITLQPGQPSLHIQLATLESQAGQTDAAAAERKIAAQLSRAATNRQHASFALKSGRALLAENKLAEAILQLNTAAQADPGVAEIHNLLAEAYQRQGKPADAAVERQRASELSNPSLSPADASHPVPGNDPN